MRLRFPAWLIAALLLIAPGVMSAGGSERAARPDSSIVQTELTPVEDSVRWNAPSPTTANPTFPAAPAVQPAVASALRQSLFQRPPPSPPSAQL